MIIYAQDTGTDDGEIPEFDPKLPIENEDLDIDEDIDMPDE